MNLCQLVPISCLLHLFTTTTVLWHFFRDHPGEPVPEENLTEARHIGHSAGRHSFRINQCPPPPSSPFFFTGRMPFLSPNQKCQGTAGNTYSLGNKCQAQEFCMLCAVPVTQPSVPKHWVELWALNPITENPPNAMLSWSAVIFLNEGVLLCLCRLSDTSTPDLPTSVLMDVFQVNLG